MPINLHPQLQADTYFLGLIKGNILLLHKNALLPWFILVPDTSENELYKLQDAQLLKVQQCINHLARFVEQHFKTDKLNIATIGNIVPQLHVHIIGRFNDDFCWPAPVWGQTQSADYTEKQIRDIKATLVEANLI
jgi:diadenosine tetraphosphate (Ap4A) HIT family hydrolase